MYPIVLAVLTTYINLSSQSSARYVSTSSLLNLIIGGASASWSEPDNQASLANTIGGDHEVGYVYHFAMCYRKCCCGEPHIRVKLKHVP